MRKNLAWVVSVALVVFSVACPPNGSRDTAFLLFLR